MRGVPFKVLSQCGCYLLRSVTTGSSNYYELVRIPDAVRSHSAFMITSCGREYKYGRNSFQVDRKERYKRV